MLSSAAGRGLNRIFARRNLAVPNNSVLVNNFHVEFIKSDPTSSQIVETCFLVKIGATE